MLLRLRIWFWPFFVFLYPWVFPLGYPQTPFGSNLVHYLFTAIMMFIWLVINYKRLRSPKRTDIQQLWKHRPVLLALAFGIWVLISSAFAPVPVVSLTGNLDTLRDSALFFTLLSLVFVAAYFDHLTGHMPTITVFKAVAWSAVSLVVAAFVELIRGDGLFYIPTTPYPMVVFMGPGHLAGFFSMALGVLGGIAAAAWSWLAAFVIAFGLGLTFNRTSIGAVALSFIVNLATPWRKRILLVLVLLAGVLTGWRAVELFADQGRSDLANTTTLEERYAYWRIALNGIALRPFFGWGGGQFNTHLSEVADEKDLKIYLFTPSEVEQSKILFGDGNFFIVEYPNGKREYRYVIDWSPHNLFLDIALLWGIVGLVIYLLLLIPGLLPALSGNPAALGILAYHLFLLLWPPAVEALGVLWVLWAIAAASYTMASKPTLKTNKTT